MAQVKLTPQVVAQATGATLLNASQWCAHLQAAIDKWGINGRIETVSMFLAQAGVESQHLTKLEEDLHYTHADRLLAVFPHEFRDLADAQAVLLGGPAAIANRVYANRLGNGDEGSGDGWRHRGMGIFQLTGKAEQEAYLAEVGDAIASTLPESVLLTMAGAADSAGWYWVQNALEYHASIGDVHTCTRIINGPGMEALAEREQLYAVAVKTLAAAAVIAA